MKPAYKTIFTKEEKAMFKSLADRVRAKREQATIKHPDAVPGEKGIL